MNPVERAARWRLDSVTVRHFRGVARERAYSFEGRPGLLHGDNGVGKSTVALATQWVLYGRFPDGVLQNTTYAQFLAPVGPKGPIWSGSVVLRRGTERLVVTREGTRAFEVQLGDARWSGEDAEARLEALLGLDEATFTRAVLLQQSRIRGLLLDDPKERNRALDRLLGMDALEHLLDLAKPKPFADAAEAWREKIRADEEKHEVRERLLAEQLDHAQQVARGLAFLNKDFNPSGLRARYAELSRDLVALGGRYGVALAGLPSCDAPCDAEKVASSFAGGVQAIRVRSELQKRLAPIATRLGELASRRERWRVALEGRDAAREALALLVTRHGEREDLEGEGSSTRDRLGALAREKKAVDALRALLGDALALASDQGARECPLCEQRLPAGLDLPARLRTRIGSVASRELQELEERERTAKARLAELEKALAEHAAAAAELDRAQQDLERQRQALVEALGGAGIAEGKVGARLGEVMGELERDRAEIAKGIDALEADLAAIALRERSVTTALLAVVRKREEIERHELAAKALRQVHAGDEERSQLMAARAQQLDAIRRALLDAKKDLAGDSLAKAGPRALQLYRALVRQPVFDTLAIQATPKANKVDYAFQVSRGGAAGTSREARLVLSDGQLTATALALFFGLAESTAHGLDLLYVDDPTQNLDLKSKEAMARVVTELASKRQVIVSTQDEDFVSFLDAAGFARGAVVHRFTSWDGDPRVESKAP